MPVPSKSNQLPPLSPAARLALVTLAGGTRVIGNTVGASHQTISKWARGIATNSDAELCKLLNIDPATQRLRSDMVHALPAALPKRHTGPLAALLQDVLPNPEPTEILYCQTPPQTIELVPSTVVSRPGAGVRLMLMSAAEQMAEVNPSTLDIKLVRRALNSRSDASSMIPVPKDGADRASWLSGKPALALYDKMVSAVVATAKSVDLNKWAAQLGFTPIEAIAALEAAAAKRSR